MFLFGGYEFPQLMTINLAPVTSVDPHFDSAGFLSFAQGAYWKIHQAAVEGDLDPVRNMLSESMLMQLQASMGTPTWQTPIVALAQASIMNVAHDANHDTVTVRIGATTAAKKKNSLVEDWTFQRPATNTPGVPTAPAPTPTQCPGCGAPISTDENGACRYCGVPIKGVVGDWRLVSTNVPKIPKSTSSSSGYRSWIVFIVLMTVVLPLVITGFVLFEVNKSTDSINSSFGSGFPFSNSNSNANSKSPSFGNPSSQPTLDGSLTLTGGLQGTMEPSTLSTTGGEVGSCTSRVANVSGVSFLSNVQNTDAGLNQQIIVNVSLPPGSKGQGTYPSADVKVVLHETALTGAGAAATKPEDNSWTSGEGSTASVTINADDSGTITFANLVTTAPQWAKLNGTLTFSCH